MDQAPRYRVYVNEGRHGCHDLRDLRELGAIVAASLVVNDGVNIRVLKIKVKPDAQ